ncbi:hypothetical protein E0L36_17805 [Streptomyces sp. AJS327]|uniref:hypothetical protein n=1 Tax=Streptomyces sp. AJS327 TaxID=2545265 RepID=UPI0015E00BBF|nr:hypothetical protein [Streptomyces sp. AJS327]MBA0052669.1 hypothetical protein [Streptomyces sp. AJS327]
MRAQPVLRVEPTSAVARSHMWTGLLASFLHAWTVSGRGPGTLRGAVLRTTAGRIALRLR